MALNILFKRVLKDSLGVNIQPKTRFTDHLQEISRRVLAMDLIVIAFSVVLAALLRWGQLINLGGFSDQDVIVFIAPVVWVIALAWQDAWSFNGFSNNSEIYVKVLRAGANVFVTLAFISFFTHAQYSRGFIIGVSIIGTLILLVLRKLLLRKFSLLRRDFKIQERILTISCCESPSLLNEADLDIPDGHYDSFVIDFSDSSWGDKVSDYISLSKADYLFICQHIKFDITRLSKITQIADQLSCTLYFLDSLHQLSSRRKTMIKSGRIHTFLEEPALRRSKAVYKRGLDIFLSGIALTALMPVMIVIACVVKLTSKGGVFYVDNRVGRGEKVFRFPKFRTMYAGSDQIRLQLLGRPDEEMTERYRNDPRITPVGRFLRRFSLDELPQLWSVFIGDMSIVGPRPILCEEVVQVDELSRYRSIAVPGLTGLWQINGRKTTTWEERMSYDLEYIHMWSPMLDMTLIFRTISVIFSGKGSY